MVIPNITDTFERDRAIDELPQSASGKTIMTTEPKFIPNEAANITIDGIIKLKVRLVDYWQDILVEEHSGIWKTMFPCMVDTPWFEEKKIPFGGSRRNRQKRSLPSILPLALSSLRMGALRILPAVNMKKRKNV